MSEVTDQTAEPSTCYRHPQTEAGVRCQRCGNIICSKCMTQASVGFHCPSCVKSGSQQVIPARQALGLGAADFTLGKILIGMNAVVHLGYEVATANRTTDRRLFDFFEDGVLYGPDVSNGEWWQLLTAGFLHANWLHLFMNMFALWIFGKQLIPQLGMTKFSIVYLGSLFAGSAGVMLHSPFSHTLGASGAIFGLLGAFAMHAVSQRRNLWKDGIISMIGIYVFFTFYVPNISIGGHMGGLFGGLILGGIFFEGGRRFRGQDNLLIGIGVAVAALFFVAGIIFAP